MKKKEEKIKLPMSFTKKIVLSLLAVCGTVFVIYMAYYLIHYKAYKGYKKFMKSYDYEEGTKFTPLSETRSDVEDMELVAENEILKLYTDTKTADIAVYDKRTGKITYSCPRDVENDSIANTTNKNYLRSQLIIGYYNADVNYTRVDSYSKSVQKKQFSFEGIKDGIRYIYRIGDIKGKDGTEGISFEIPLEYRLSEDSLVVCIPTGKIVEYGGGALSRIDILRYMGAAEKTEEGYLVVPNGSGSIINFNNGKKTAGNYSQYIYEIDPLVQNFTTLENTDGARLPIFGICRKDGSILGTVEGGATLSCITAGVSEVINDYNYVYSTFVIRNVDNLRMFGNSQTDVYVLEKNLYDTELTVRYSFLTEEEKGYVGIAKHYRNELIKEGKLARAEASSDIPFYYDVFGGVKETSHFLGVQYLRVLKMTDFDEAEEMAEMLKEAGVNNQVMNFQGWFNGGYYNDPTDHIDVISKLGGKKGLEDLSKKMEELNGRFYADVAFNKISYEAKGFNENEEASRYYGAGYTAGFGLVNPTTLRNTYGLGYLENLYDVLSPRYLPRYVEAFAKKIKRYDIDGISLRDLGNYLASDKKRTSVIDREQALNIVLGQLDILKKTEKNLMFDQANAYAFTYADDLINIPMDDNDFLIIDEEIPLYQMIIHGAIDYSSELLNFEDDKDTEKMILKLIETGTAPHYLFTWEEASKMKNTAMNRYYSTTFDVWFEKATDTYLKVNEALKNVEGAFMTDHEILQEGVRKVTYDNGVIIYVNYTDHDVNINEITIPKMSYRLEGRR